MIINSLKSSKLRTNRVIILCGLPKNKNGFDATIAKAVFTEGVLPAHLNIICYPATVYSFSWVAPVVLAVILGSANVFAILLVFIISKCLAYYCCQK